MARCLRSALASRAVKPRGRASGHPHPRQHRRAQRRPATASACAISPTRCCRCSQAHAQGIDWVINICGRFELPPEFDDLKPQPNVAMRGFVPDIDEEVRGNHIFLLLNNAGPYTGGYTRVIYAFSSGSCLIAHTRLAESMPELVHGRNCLLGATPEEIADHIAAAARDPALRARLGEAARAPIRGLPSLASSPAACATWSPDGSDARATRRHGRHRQGSDRARAIGEPGGAVGIFDLSGRKDALGMPVIGGDADWEAWPRRQPRRRRHPHRSTPQKRRRALARSTASIAASRSFRAAPAVARPPKTGHGSIVQSGACLSADAVVGAGVKINVGASVHHDCRIGVFRNPCSRRAAARTVTVDDDCYVGAHAVVLPNLRSGAKRPSAPAPSSRATCPLARPSWACRPKGATDMGKSAANSSRGSSRR